MVGHLRLLLRRFRMPAVRMFPVHAGCELLLGLLLVGRDDRCVHRSCMLAAALACDAHSKGMATSAAGAVSETTLCRFAGTEEAKQHTSCMGQLTHWSTYCPVVCCVAPFMCPDKYLTNCEWLCPCEHAHANTYSAG